jgi:hypothetical protein
MLAVEAVVNVGDGDAVVSLVLVAVVVVTSGEAIGDCTGGGTSMIGLGEFPLTMLANSELGMFRSIVIEDRRIACCCCSVFGMPDAKTS